MEFYNSINGLNWMDNIGWVDGVVGIDCDLCMWYGVGCDGNGRVMCIDLDGVVNLCMDGLNGGGNNFFGNLFDLDLLFLIDILLSWNNFFGLLLDF